MAAAASLAAALCCLFLAGQVAAAPFERLRAVPAELVYGSGKPLRVKFRVAARGAVPVRIELVRSGSGRVVKGFARTARPGRRRAAWLSQTWAGRTWAGKVAPAGSYRVRISVRRPGLGWRSATDPGRFRFRTHVFPVTGEHGVRGPVGEYGAGRTGGRSHEGFDITAPCGRDLVAVRAGRVTEVGYDPVLYGHNLTLRGRGEPYSYFYSHLRLAPPVGEGRRLRTGTVVGEVGQTGNAASTPCHLHFEVRESGHPFDPRPLLEGWGL